ncbi:MAG TPA: DUF1360 domain-containing protein [Solirubrobacterales bacterium]|nr:DUF1360 domain-containing protein [Solirubrobacterales bacterium]
MAATQVQHAAQQGEQPGPAEYASLNAVYAVALAGLVAGTHRRGDDVREVLGTELIPLTAATFAVSKMIARERIGSWVREPFVDDPVGRKRPRGGSVRRALGELVTCSRCVGAWTALGFVGLRVAHPRAGRTATAVFAVAGLNDFAQAGFRALCDWANQQH